MTYNAIHGRVLGWDKSGLLFNKMPIGIPCRRQGKIFCRLGVRSSRRLRLNPLEVRGPPWRAAVTSAPPHAAISSWRSAPMPRTSRPRPHQAIAKANITIIGLGNGRSLPDADLHDRQHRDHRCVRRERDVPQFRFVANFLSIAAAITLTTATGFAGGQCAFHDTLGVLNFPERHQVDRRREHHRRHPHQKDAGGCRWDDLGEHAATVGERYR